MCFSPQRRAIFRHLNFKKCSETDVFCTFSLPNVCFATAACNFSTSELQKVLRNWRVLYIFTSQCAFHHIGVQFFDIWTSKSAPKLTCFVHFRFKMCFSPQRRAIFRHLNFKKCSETDVFCTFSLPNVLFTTSANNFSTSELPKVLRGLQFFNILTSKCAFRHSGVQFFDIWTSKSAPKLTCFVHFHFPMCFSPHRRTIFRHLNFKKCSETDVFCTLSLQNVLFATAACNFSTSELRKVLRDPQFFSMFTSKCAFRHSGVQFLMSPLSTYLRTRRFNRPTFRLTRHTNHWKNTAFRDFSNIWRGCIFFLRTFALVHLFTFDLTACLICFSTLHIVGSFYLNFLRSYMYIKYIYIYCETSWT